MIYLQNVTKKYRVEAKFKQETKIQKVSDRKCIIFQPFKSNCYSIHYAIAKTDTPNWSNFSAKNELNQFEVLSPSLAAISELNTLTATFRKRIKKIRIQIYEGCVFSMQSNGILFQKLFCTTVRKKILEKKIESEKAKNLQKSFDL